MSFEDKRRIKKGGAVPLSRAATRRSRQTPNWGLHLAMVPLAATALAAYLGATFWTIFLSFTRSKLVPNTTLAGLAQYRQLFSSERWGIASANLVLFAAGSILMTTFLGLALAIFMDQRIRAESLWRSIFLYPYAMSFVVTGLVWQWIFNPEMGLQAAVQRLGFPDFQLDWIVTQDKVMYCVIIAAVWQGSGLVMAVMLAGLRGVDSEIWKAASLDGIPAWRTYASIVLPMASGAIMMAIALQVIAAIKVYDVVVAMTRGGPGLASEVPAKFILDQLGGRANLGQASAASTVLLMTVVTLLVPIYYLNKHQATKRGRAT